MTEAAININNIRKKFSSQNIIQKNVARKASRHLARNERVYQAKTAIFKNKTQTHNWTRTCHVATPNAISSWHYRAPLLFHLVICRRIVRMKPESAKFTPNQFSFQ